MKRLLPLFPLTALLLLTMGVGPCDSKPLGSVDGCRYAGKSYPTGATFGASDGCNTCQCQTGGVVACTTVACADGGASDGGQDGGNVCFDSAGNVVSCAPDGGVACTLNGKTYMPGATFPSTDGCNTCSCTSTGTIACTTKACVDGGPAADGGIACWYDGKQYPVGGSFPSGDGCNTCSCTSTGMVACTERACADAGPPTDAGVLCSYDGKSYPVGASFPSTDGCNTCSCTSTGMVACTEKACFDAGTTCYDASGNLVPCPTSDGGVMTCYDANGKVVPCPTSDGGLPGACMPGADQTCNDNPAVNALLGKCRPDATCDCGTNMLNPATGRCLTPSTTTGCTYDGTTYAVGSKFMCPLSTSCSDGVCYCAPPGQTTVLCPGDTLPVCAFDAVYTYGDTGGLVLYTDQVTLTPPASYVLVRTANPNAGGAASGSCGPALPACNGPGIDVSEVMAAISDPTVQLLLSLSTTQPTLLGIDQRPVDGTVFAFKRAGGAGFLVGAPCGGASGCTDIPPTVTNLVDILRKLDAQQRPDPSCQAFLNTM